jgi:hypothetical protein
MVIGVIIIDYCCVFCIFIYRKFYCTRYSKVGIADLGTKKAFSSRMASLEYLLRLLCHY